MNNLKFTETRFFIILLLIIIGIGLCLDLSYIFYKTNFHEIFRPSFCTVSELIDCDGVARTQYSVSMGVPNALWGLILYCVMLMLLFVDRIQAKFKNTIFDVFKNPQSYIASLALLSFGISMILACISIFEIKKICVLCFATYFVDFFIAITARGKGFFFEDIKTTILDFLDGVKKYTVLFIIVLIAFVSTLFYLDDTMIFSPKLKKERQYKEFYESKKNKYAIKGNVLGNKKSDVVIKIYSDYNCPFCRIANIMIHKLAQRENIFVEEVNYPLDVTCNPSSRITLGGHESSCLAARYALAARKQGKFWGAASVLFDTQPRTEEEIIEQFEKEHLGLNEEKLRQDANSPEVYQELQNDINEAVSNGVQATPSIEINKVLYTGMLPYDEMIVKIKDAHKRAKN